MEEQKPSAEPKKLTKEELAEQVRLAVDNVQQGQDRERRLRKLHSAQGWRDRFGKFHSVDPSYVPTDEELREMVPLKTDRLQYRVLAVTRNGFYAQPKVGGRRKKHWTKRVQQHKAMALQVFRKLWADRAEDLKARHKDFDVVYQGVPEDAIPEIGAKATKIALQLVKQQRRAKRRAKRRQQEFHRKVNAGLLNGSVGEANYMWKGKQWA